MIDAADIEIKNKSEAIRKLYPQVATIYPGDVWKCVDENNASVEINESEVTKEVDRADAEYTSQAYARKRKEEYPDIGDQLDDLYHAGAFSVDMAAKLEKVKDDNPKG